MKIFQSTSYRVDQPRISSSRGIYEKKIPFLDSCSLAVRPRQSRSFSLDFINLEFTLVIAYFDLPSYVTLNRLGYKRSKRAISFKDTNLFSCFIDSQPWMPSNILQSCSFLWICCQNLANEILTF